MALRIAKILTCLTLVFAYLSGTNHYLVFYITFQINHDFIVEQLCIERDKEVNTCQGCCQQEKFIKHETENKLDDIVPIFPENNLATHIVKGSFQHIQYFSESRLCHVDYFLCIHHIPHIPDSPPPELS